MRDEPRHPLGVLFDLDGTLLDTAPDLAAALNFARQEVLSLGPVRPERLQGLVTKGARAMISDDLPAGLTDADLDLVQSTMLGYYREHIADFTDFFAGIPNVIDHFDKHHLKWGVVTNKLSVYALPLLEAMKLHKRAHCVLCADMVESPKPAPDALLEAAANLGLPANQCVYVGDAKTDMVAARNAGMFAAAAEWGYIAADDVIASWPFDKRFANPKLLLEWIKNLPGN